MLDTIRELIDRHGKMPVPASDLADDQELFAAGLDAFHAVRVMLAVEDAFEIVFPEHMLNRANFASIAAIALSVAEVFPSKLQTCLPSKGQALEHAA